MQPSLIGLLLVCAALAAARWPAASVRRTPSPALPVPQARPQPRIVAGSAVVVEACRKTYGEVVAVDGFDFAVAEGEIFGLLGPDGAGKTTTLACIEALRHPTAGTWRVRGIVPSREPGRLRDAS